MRALVTSSVLLGMVVAGSTAAWAADCPSTADSVRKDVGVSAEWDVSCTDSDSGQRLMAALKKPSSAGAAPRLVVMVKAPDGGTARTELALDGPEQAVIQAITAETWHVILFDEELNGQHLIHVSTFARTGGETPVAQEIVTLLRPENGKLAHVWTGLGYRSEQQASGCYLETKMKFKLTAGQLERTARTKAKVKAKRKLTPAESKQLKQSCVAPPQKVDMFAVPIAAAGAAAGPGTAAKAPGK